MKYKVTFQLHNGETQSLEGKGRMSQTNTHYIISNGSNPDILVAKSEVKSVHVSQE